MQSKNEIRKQVTVDDIAQKSGYSCTSVSFAFNKPGRISEKARKRILEVADELGYVPDPGARNFAKGRYNAIGFLLPQESEYSLSNPHILGILKGVVGVCETNSYTLSILPPIKSSIDQAVRNSPVDGFITVGLTITDDISKSFEIRQLPIVTIGGEVRDGFASVNICDEEAGVLILEKAIEKGHRRFAFVNLKDPVYGEFHKSSVVYQRIQGYQKVLRAHNIALEDCVTLSVDSSIEGGREAANKIFDEYGNKVTCIVSMADIISIGIMNAAKERGIAIPEDHSLVSFDGVDEAYCNYGLTTIVQNPQKKGEAAAKTLFSMLEGNEVSSMSVTIPFGFRSGNTLGECKN